MSDPVNHPEHYTSHPSGVECIEVIAGAVVPIGNCIKYIWRCGLKGDIPIQDLDKAMWYLEYQLTYYGPTGANISTRTRRYEKLTKVIEKEEELSKRGDYPVTEGSIHKLLAEIYTLFRDGNYYKIVFPLIRLRKLIEDQQPVGVPNPDPEFVAASVIQAGGVVTNATVSIKDIVQSDKYSLVEAPASIVKVAMTAVNKS